MPAQSIYANLGYFGLSDAHAEFVEFHNPPQVTRKKTHLGEIHKLWDLAENKGKLKEIFDLKGGIATKGNWFAKDPLQYTMVSFGIGAIRSMDFYVNFSAVQRMGILFRPLTKLPCRGIWTFAITPGR